MLKARPATSEDVPYVLDSFVRQIKASPYVEGLTRSQTRGLLVKLLENAEWNCTILIEDEVPDEILAWVCWRSPCEIAWIATKGLFRRKGLAHRLLSLIGAERGPVRATFIPSPAFSRSARSRGWRLLHRPYLGVV